MIVCDVCGKAPADTIRITARGKNYQKDLCSTHLSELIGGARAPRRGRPPKATASTSAAPATPRRRGRPPKAAASAPATPRRRGRPPKAAQAAPAAAKSGRKRGPITDPVLLQKRRDALAKARAARAAKRAAAK